MADSTNLVQKKRTHLERSVHNLGVLVIEALRRSVSCFREQDLALAEQIVAEDGLINHRRRVLEQECLVTLAAFKPAAEDLRGIGSCLGVVCELERIGDYAADVARFVRSGGGAELRLTARRSPRRLSEDSRISTWPNRPQTAICR
jgi:phosphate transport system protein